MAGVLPVLGAPHLRFEKQLKKVLTPKIKIQYHGDRFQNRPKTFAR
jgi:hypothetical protein